MGQLVLLMFAQAVGALGFAYFTGTVALKRKAIPCAVTAAGMYMMLGSALVQAGTERLGWTDLSLAAAYALVTGGAGLMGAGALLRKHHDVEPVRWERYAGLVTLGATVVCAIALVALSGSLIDADGLRAVPFEDGWSRLAPAGWALGAPLALGAAGLVVRGARDALVAKRWKGALLWAAGVVLAAWPLDLRLGSVPLMPVVMLLGMALVYLAVTPPKGGGASETVAGDGAGPKTDTPGADGKNEH
jgi:hypothetical protein